MPEGWEVEVGSNWLNKAGVLIFITGLALLLGYSMAHVGAFGRVSMGFAIAAAMLAAGVLIERQPPYASYGHGLVAGGWAGTYVTAFAMHALPAARVIENDLAAALVLLAVAGAMVWHSLRYRSQTVTALAFVAASLPLALTPLSAFSLVAALPLAAALLIVARQFGWSGLSLLGLGSTYVLFALRTSPWARTDADLSITFRYVLLAMYWLTFEIADVLTWRAGRARAPHSPLFAANVIGSLGCLFLLRPFDDPRLGTMVVGCAALGYFFGSIVRARLRPAPDVADTSERPFDTSHAALAVSAALTAWALGMQFDGPSLLLGLLLEAQLLIVSAFALGDRQVRRIGGGAALLVTCTAWIHAASPSFVDRIEWPWHMSAWSPVVALVAICWYVNHERLRRQHPAVDRSERLYAWAASILVGAIIAGDVPVLYAGLAGMGFALALLMAGTRSASEYRYQAYIALLIGVRAVLGHFAAPVTAASHDQWPILLSAVAVAYAFAWWADRHRSMMSLPERRLVSLEAGGAAVVLLAMFEWRVTPRLRLGGTWAMTAAAFTVLGTRRRVTGLRWQAYVLAGAAALQGLLDVVWLTPKSTLWSGLTIAGVYACGLISRQALIGEKANADALVTAERTARIVVVAAATWLLTVLLGNRLSANLVTMGWGLEGIVLLIGGFLIRERVLRLAGLAILFLCILKLFFYDLRELEALGRIISFVVLGLVLLGVSWTYTKYKDQLRRLL